MAFYDDATQIYAPLQALFEHLRHETPNPIDTLLASHLSIRLMLTDPEAQITIMNKNKAK